MCLIPLVFRELLRPHSPSGKHFWMGFAQQWNNRSDGKEVFYKNIEYLESYHKIWKANCAAANTYQLYAGKLKGLEARVRAILRRTDVPGSR
jgi:hypothetical protein